MNWFKCQGEMDSEKKLSFILDFRCQIVVLDFRWLSRISDVR